MNKIQWFPGHMTKALREMEQNIKKVDLVIYVLDSRAPYSCLNPEFREVIGNKPIIYVLNKADLVDVADLKYWEKYLSAKNAIALSLVSTLSNASKVIVDAMQKLLASKIERNKSKGVNMPLRSMVIGVPNCGKSTLINNLCGKYNAKTGDKPSITRSTQWVRIGAGLEVLDTPGTLWPSFADDTVAHNLAYINAIKSDVLDIASLSLDFIEFLLDDYKDLFFARYSITRMGEPPLFYLEEICRNRGFLLRGGEIDYERGANALFDDFRKGRIGKIMLDKPRTQV